jgi:hypothetical protein
MFQTIDYGKYGYEHRFAQLTLIRNNVTRLELKNRGNI